MEYVSQDLGNGQKTERKEDDIEMLDRKDEEKVAMETPLCTADEATRKTDSGGGAGDTSAAIKEGEANSNELENKMDDETNDKTEVAKLIAVEDSGTGTTENAEEKNSSVHSEVAEPQTTEVKNIIEEEAGEEEVEVKTGDEGALDTEHESVVNKATEQSGNAEALETRKIEAEANGDKHRGTDQSSEGKSEAGDDDAHDISPSPKRRKTGGRSVARTTARKGKDLSKPPRHPERVELLKKMTTLEDMKKLVAEHGKSETEYKVGDMIEVDDLVQTDYEYKLEAPVGKKFAEGFDPAFSPKEMLSLGIFEGKVINDCIFEFPKEWYEEAIEKGKLSPEGPDDSKNQFKVKSLPANKEGRKRGLFHKVDPHGWFQWYCRYYLGRRLEPDDTYQMSRWRQIRRHAGQVKKNCEPGDLSCRVKQRQTLLDWSHDCFM